MRTSRRTLLRMALGGGVALGLGGLGTRLARAAEGENLLLSVYFSGGWDQLLTWDPRPADEARFKGDAPYQPGGTGIHPAYELVGDGWMQDVLDATGGSGIQSAGGLDVGPSVPPELLAHAADLSIVRGVNMGTLTHEVGRRFFLTGQFPRGLQPVGSSLPSLLASAEGQPSTIPNLSIETESYAVGLPAFASPIQVRDAQDVRDMLRILGPGLEHGSDAVAELLARDPSCRSLELDGEGKVTQYLSSRDKAQAMVLSGQDALFNFNAGNPGVNEALFDALRIANNADLNGEKGSAAIAAQALTKGVARAVSVRLVQGIDDHDDWASGHPTVVRNGLMVLGDLIAYLKSQPSPFGASGKSTWDHTTLLCFSEFARTPLLNGRDGRDHHLASSCLVAGPGIARGRVIGGTSDEGMGALGVDDAGAPLASGGTSIGPDEVIKTLLTSMGMGDVSLGNQPVAPIDALLA